MKRTKKTKTRAKAAILSVLLGLALLTAAAAAASAQTIDSLIGQIQVAITHAKFSYTSTAIGPRVTHAHHVVNILEGAQGPNFDGSKGNPGDGYGAINYALDAAKEATGTAADYAQNTVAFLQWAAEEALKATKATSFEEAGVYIRRALAYLSAALGRPDDDGPLGTALALKAAQPARVTIDIYNFRFGDGQPLTVKVGTTVTWVNHDSTPHTVTGGPLDSGNMNQHDTYTYTFTQPGTYEYICVYHPMMKHTIIVVE